jgi:hypothetical protein
MNLLKRIVGDDRQHLLDVCDKTIFFCQFEKPFSSYKKIVVIAPLMSELESSFALWVERIIRLGKELNLKIELYASESTFEWWTRVKEANKISSDTKWVEIEELDDFFLVNQKKSDTDLIVYCSSRNGSISYVSTNDSISGKLEKAYSENDFITIYPSQSLVENMFSTYEDIDASAIAKGVETFQKIGKEVGNIFKKSS